MMTTNPAAAALQALINRTTNQAELQALYTELSSIFAQALRDTRVGR